MKARIIFCASMITLAASLATAQKPCGPTPIPRAALVINWPQFHFDANHSGCNSYESILSPSTVGALTLAWEFQTIGQIEGSPAVVNGIVYIGSEDHNLYALNANTGALVWKYDTGYWADYSPAVANGKVYAHLVDNGTGLDYDVALNAATGKEVWRSTVNGRSTYTTPTVANGVVYTGAGRNVAALNGATGDVIWLSDDIDADSHSVPSVAGGVVYATTENGYMYAFDANTGAVL